MRSTNCSSYCSIGKRRQGHRTGCPASLSTLIVIETWFADLWLNEVETQTYERSQQTMSEEVVQLNEAVFESKLKQLARGSVEETLNELLEATHTDCRVCA